jgi:hypothetical protein
VLLLYAVEQERRSRNKLVIPKSARNDVRGGRTMKANTDVTSREDTSQLYKATWNVAFVNAVFGPNLLTSRADDVLIQASRLAPSFPRRWQEQFTYILFCHLRRHDNNFYGSKRTWGSFPVYSKKVGHNAGMFKSVIDPWDWCVWVVK